jgi:hypothetical protein
MPPKTSSMYPGLISRALCSDGMRCIKPFAPSRNETNSSRVSGGADGAILLVCACGCSDQPGTRRNMFDSLPGKDASAAPQESERSVGLDESTDALTVSLSIRQKRKRSIGHSNQRATSMLLRLLAIAGSGPPRETQVVVKTSWVETLAPECHRLMWGAASTRSLRLPIQK